MLYLHSLSDAEEVFKALSTPVRLRIMEMIYEDENLSMNDLAERLDVTNSAISMHVGKLEAAGLVSIQTTSGKRGVMKLVHPVCDRMIVDLSPKARSSSRSCYNDSIAVGYFSAADVHPTCGLATTEYIIGDLDNPKVFSYPERFKAGILWIGYGSITYNLPNRLRAGQKATEIQISLEISSECPEFNEDYPSDIYFYINDILLGKWISPGDFGARHGILSPAWWPELLNQYGLLKTLVINDEGTFMDGTYKLSDVTLQDLRLDYNSSLDLKLAVPKDTANCGGLTIFGEGFGDYNQNIQVKIYYEDPEQAL
ncbi:MAG: metalloregulator ArsR/SmtB family transcription factor [Lachnospiraceae bacterium]|nr:metalloregulator ArsR/SmtB family transcription factor [Lachnospiraceae bacterium]